MFFEEGWVPLAEATAEVFRRLQTMQAAGNPGARGNLTATLAISVWDICDACSKIGVTGSDGAVISASKDLVNWADPSDLSNEHVHLIAGTVGSTTLPDETGAVPTQDALTLRYGPFVNLPLVLPVNNFQSSLTFLEEEVTAQANDDPAIAEAAQTIIGALVAKRLVTREIMRAKLGATLSRRKFKLAWGLAAQQHPELAAPNRWQGI